MPSQQLDTHVCPKKPTLGELEEMVAKRFKRIESLVELFSMKMLGEESCFGTSLSRGYKISVEGDEEYGLDTYGLFAHIPGAGVTKFKMAEGIAYLWGITKNRQLLLVEVVVSGTWKVKIEAVTPLELLRKTNVDRRLLLANLAEFIKMAHYRAELRLKRFAEVNEVVQLEEFLLDNSQG